MTGAAQPAVHRWLDPEFLADAVGWVRASLAAAGRGLTGEPEQTHVRAWATVLRCPTHEGDVWFKAMARGTAHEVGLLMALAAWCPDRVLVPIAAEAERGWLLLPDGGTTLRAAMQGQRPDEAHWADILADHAEFQRLVAPHADEQLAALRADADRFAGWCADLAAIGVPAAVNHDDLHDANLFAPPEPGGHYRVFDWGDASVAHPFAVLLVALPEGAPELLRLRDAYLEPWTAEHDRADLVEAVRLALRVGGVSRSRSYRAALDEASAAEVEETGSGVPLWLLETYSSTPVEPDPPALPPV